MNPSCVRFSGTPRPILNTLDEFQAILDGGESKMLTVDLGRQVAAEAYDKLCTMPKVRLIGDIAFYYLTYVEQMIDHNPQVRFICLKRDREKTIRSWMRKSMVGRWRSKRLAERLASWITREPFHESRNFWMEHDGSVWQSDPIWDKCFPKFDARDKADAIGQYWDYYYREAEQLADRHPERFRIVETDKLEEPAFQSDLLTFCGVPESEQIAADAHLHKSRAA